MCTSNRLQSLSNLRKGIEMPESLSTLGKYALMGIIKPLQLVVGAVVVTVLIVPGTIALLGALSNRRGGSYSKKLHNKRNIARSKKTNTRRNVRLSKLT